MNTLITKINRVLKKDKKIFSAYVFGSYARGTTNQFSDIDIAVLFDPKLKNTAYTDRKAELMEQISRLLHKDVDVVVLNKASLFLRYQVLREGKRIFDSPARKNHTFEANSLMQYFDFLPYKNRMEEGAIRRIKNG